MMKKLKRLSLLMILELGCMGAAMPNLIEAKPAELKINTYELKVEEEATPVVNPISSTAYNTETVTIEKRNNVHFTGGFIGNVYDANAKEGSDYYVNVSEGGTEVNLYYTEDNACTIAIIDQSDRLIGHKTVYKNSNLDLEWVDSVLKGFKCPSGYELDKNVFDELGNKVTDSLEITADRIFRTKLNKVNNYKSFDKVIEVSNERIEFLTLSPLKRLSIINLNSFSFINHKHHILSIGNNQSLSYQAKQHIYIEDSKISFEIICNKDKRFIPYPSSRFTVYQSTHIKEEYSHLKAFIVKQFKIDSKSGIDIITALSDKLKEIEVNKVKEEKNKVLLNNLSEIKNQNKNLLNEISTLKEEYKSSLNIYQHKELSITNISLSYMKIKVKKNIRKYLITKYFFTCNSKFPNSTKDNKRFKERIKYLFGKSFTFEDFFIDEKLSKYSSKEQSLNAKVIQLKIEKQKIKNELNQLKSELNKLSFESKLNGKYSLLEQIKEENIILKADIEKLRKTNEHQKKMIENVKQMNISYYEPVKTKFRKSNSQKDLLTADYSFEQ